MPDYYYCVDLKILHEDMDAEIITNALHEFEVKHEATAGEERKRYDNGEYIILPGVAKFTCWSAKLHLEKKIHSLDMSLDEFLSITVLKLKKYHKFLNTILEAGEMKFCVGWFCEHSIAGESLHGSTLKKCGDMGIGLELYIYGHDLPQKL